MDSRELVEDMIEGMAPETRANRDFAEMSADWFWEQDAEFRFTRFFGLAPEKLFRDQADFIGKRRWEMPPISGFSPEQLAEHIALHEAHKPFHNFEYTATGLGGVLQYYSVSGMPAFDAQGNFAGYHGMARNISNLRIAELAIKESVRRLRQIVDGSPIATFVIDAEHRVTHWNRACEQLTGFSREDIIGQTDTWKAFYPQPALISDAVEAEEFFPNMGEDGRWLYLTAVPLRDSEQKLTGAIETCQDITDQRKAQLALQRLASRDGLTGIANRRCFDDTIGLEWKRRNTDLRCMSLLILDIDHFKAYNDTYGHPAGDRCLQQIASALEQLLYRPNDVIARYGGEEFAVIMPGSDEDGAIVVATRILERVAELAIPHSGVAGGRVTLSIGISTSKTRTDMSLESLISSADKALYKAKEGGRNRLVVDRPLG